MRIGGIIDISTKDIPHRTCMVIFTVGCNFKCEFCQNKYLLYEGVGKHVEVNELLKIIKSNQLVKSVSISGGEPTLQDDLVELCELVSKEGNYVSVDTNGSNPRVIKKILPYINRVALDMKASLLDHERYREVIGYNIDLSQIIETYEILNSNDKIDFEVRTTYAEKLISPKDIHEIISFLQDNKFRGNYVLQQYQYSDGVDEKYKDMFQKPTHGTMLEILKKYNDLDFNLFLRNEVVGYESLKDIIKSLEREK